MEDVFSNEHFYRDTILDEQEDPITLTKWARLSLPEVMDSKGSGKYNSFEDESNVKASCSSMTFVGKSGEASRTIITRSLNRVVSILEIIIDNGKQLYNNAASYTFDEVVTNTRIIADPNQYQTC